MQQFQSLALDAFSWLIANPALAISTATGAVGWGGFLRRPLGKGVRFLAYWGTAPVWATAHWICPAPTPEAPFVPGLVAAALLDGLDHPDTTPVAVEVTPPRDGKPRVEQQRLWVPGAEVWLEDGHLHAQINGEDVMECLCPKEYEAILVKVAATLARLRQKEIDLKAKRAWEAMQVSYPGQERTVPVATRLPMLANGRKGA